ncbi:MAG: P-II family nitrogen regulator [Mariprofundaceae bacterium]
MSLHNFTVLTDVSLITCIIQRGYADDVIQAAQNAGAQGATINFGHGVGVHEILGVFSVAIDVEKEIINTVVANSQVERIFEAMFLAGQLDTPGKGLMYVTQLDKAATFIHPEVLARLEAKEA